VSKEEKRVFSRDAVETSQELHESEFGAHFLVVYPDLVTFRETYSQYVKEAMKDNEIVIILPFYETVNDVRRIMSEDGLGISVRRYEREQSLLIMDSLKAYFGLKFGLIPFLNQTVEYAKKSGKDGVTVIGDMGSFFYSQNANSNLLQYEMTLPEVFEDMNLKGFCFYHRRDFNGRLTEQEKRTLLGHHGKTKYLLPSLIGS
jgi:MEDS: MEthanogen/methylotroph, DcmR Sensory domain